MKRANDFRFKKFTVSQESATHKVGTDGVLLGAWVSIENTLTILDVGTGSGVIALMLAQRTSERVTIDAIELQREDAAQARINVKQSPWPHRVKVIEGRAQDHSAPYSYDLIISNPPYFKSSVQPPSNKRAMARHNNSLSPAELLHLARRLLGSTGRLAVILPYREGVQFLSLAETSYGLYCFRQCDLRSRKEKPIERVLLEFSFSQRGFAKDELVLYNEANEWSAPFKSLTGDFYLNF